MVIPLGWVEATSLSRILGLTLVSLDGTASAAGRGGDGLIWECLTEVFGLRDEAHRGISAVAAISGDFGMRC